MNSEKILVLHTGGTIGSIHNPEKNHREVDVGNAKRILFEAFEKSNSKYADRENLFVDLPLGFETLSENMTLEKLSKIIAKLKSVDLDEYAGVIVLHGTDTLAYTAALFSFVFSVAIGALWEIYEFTLDSFLELNMQKYRENNGTPLIGQEALFDTMKDIVIDTLGALAVAVWGYMSMKTNLHWLSKYNGNRKAQENK